VDVSGSGLFGSRAQSKRELAAEIASVLAFSAIRNNDKVGLLLFTDEVEKFIPPRKGRSHVLRVIREVLFFEPKRRGTDLNRRNQHRPRQQPRCLCVAAGKAAQRPCAAVPLVGRGHHSTAHGRTLLGGPGQIFREPGKTEAAGMNPTH
jgi:uncharacterized protein (DUF58 family)